MFALPLSLFFIYIMYNNKIILQLDAKHANNQQ